MESFTVDIISSLLLQRLRGELNSEEDARLTAWISEDPARAQLVERLDSAEGLSALLGEYATVDHTLDQQLVSAIPSLRNVLFTVDQPENTQRTIPAAHRIHFLRRGWFRYAAAILLMISLGSVIYLWNAKKENGKMTSSAEVRSTKVDVLPGSDKAILTLADGKQIHLDSNANQLLAEKGITNQDALITYSNKGVANAINTLATPKGGQYKIRLSDGTMVWLNAASSITYPTYFSGNNREVSVTGEAYFEVVKNKEKPFLVNTAKENITVLGTSFNVNVYRDESAGKTSLIEGSIKIDNKVLQPGQAYQNGKVVATNTTQDIAWKNGIINFNDMDVPAALRQVSRWYNVEIVYKGKVPNKQLGGGVDRDIHLLQVLESLSDLGIHTELKGNTLIVLPE